MSATTRAVVAAGGGSVNGENPPAGADINFWLKAPADWRITILGANGDTINTLRGAGRAGLNRSWWNLRYEAAHTPRLRTAPVGSPWMTVGADGWRPLVVWGGGGASASPAVPPGTYNVKLAVAGHEFTQQLRVLRDPKSLGTEADIRTQVGFVLDLRTQVNETVDMINSLEWTRKQLQDVSAILHERTDATSGTLARATSDLEQKATAIETLLEDVTLTGRSEDSFRAPMGLYARFLNLAGGANGGADLPPTAQQADVATLLKQKLAELRTRFRELRDRDLPALNDKLRGAAVTVISMSGDRQR